MLHTDVACTTHGSTYRTMYAALILLAVHVVSFNNCATLFVQSVEVLGLNNNMRMYEIGICKRDRDIQPIKTS